MNRQRVSIGLALSHSIYRQRFTFSGNEEFQQAVDTWTTLLTGVADGIGEQAFEHFCRRSPHPPTPADIIKAAEEIAATAAADHERQIAAENWAETDAMFERDTFADMRPIAEFLRRHNLASHDRPDNVGGSIGSGQEPDIDAATKNRIAYGTSVGDWLYCQRCRQAITLDERCEESQSYYVDAVGWFHRRCPVRGTRPSKPTTSGMKEENHGTAIL